jgi:hypothetical protein
MYPAIKGALLGEVFALLALCSLLEEAFELLVL